MFLRLEVLGGALDLLAVLERCVRDRGGGHAFGDTDSMAIVTDYRDLESSERAKPLSERNDAISRQAIEEIVDRFKALSPYRFDGSLLKVEDENFDSETGARGPLYAYVISAKRYVLFDFVPGGFRIRKTSEHGLGTYRPPYSRDDASVD